MESLLFLFFFFKFRQLCKIITGFLGSIGIQSHTCFCLLESQIVNIQARYCQSEPLRYICHCIVHSNIVWRCCYWAGSDRAGTQGFVLELLSYFNVIVCSHIELRGIGVEDFRKGVGTASLSSYVWGELQNALKSSLE